MAASSPASTLIYTLLVVLAVIYIFPFLVQIATSFKTDADAAAKRPDPGRGSCC